MKFIMSTFVWKKIIWTPFHTCLFKYNDHKVANKGCKKFQINPVTVKTFTKNWIKWGLLDIQKQSHSSIPEWIINQAYH